MRPHNGLLTEARDAAAQFAYRCWLCLHHPRGCIALRCYLCDISCCWCGAILAPITYDTTRTSVSGSHLLDLPLCIRQSGCCPEITEAVNTFGKKIIIPPNHRLNFGATWVHSLFGNDTRTFNQNPSHHLSIIYYLIPSNSVSHLWELFAFSVNKSILTKRHYIFLISTRNGLQAELVPSNYYQDDVVLGLWLPSNFCQDDVVLGSIRAYLSAITRKWYTPWFSCFLLAKKYFRYTKMAKI